MSKGKEEVEVTVRLSAGQAINELGKLEMQAGDIKASLKDMKKGSDEFVAATKELAGVNARIATMRETLGTAGMTLRQLRTYAGELKREFDTVTAGTDRWEALASKMREVNTAIAQQSAATKPLKGFWESITTEVKQFGMLAVGALGFQFVSQQVSNLIEKGSKLSDELSDVQKTTNMTAAEVRQLNSDLAKVDTRTSTSELRKIAAVAGQLGIAKEDIMAFTVATDKLNVALGDEFGGGAEEITKVMGGLRNVFSDIKSDKVDEDMMHIGNAINQLGATGSATGPVVADFANRIGGVGITMGLTSGQVLGLSATLQELNITTERGGTATVKILQKMAAEPEKFAKVAGMSAKEFAHLVDTDLYGALVKVTEGAAKSGSQATSLAKILDTLGVDGAGASEVMAKLGANTDLLQQRVKLAGDSLGSTNSIMSEFATKNDNLAGKMEKLTKLLTGAFTNSAFNDVLEGLADGLIKLFGLTDEADELTAAFEKQQGVVQGLEQNTAPLIERYKELQGKTNLNKNEQEELRKVIDQLAISVPTAVTAWDKYGKAVAINTDIADEFLKRQQKVLQLDNKAAIDAQQAALEALVTRQKALLVEMNRKDDQGNPVKRVMVQNGADALRMETQKATDADILAWKAYYDKLSDEIATREAKIATLKGEKTKEQLEAERRVKAAGNKKTAEEELGLLAEIDAKLKALREKQLTDRTKAEIRADEAQIKALTKQRADLLGEADEKEKKAQEKRDKAKHDAAVAAAVKQFEDLKAVVMREEGKLRDANQDADTQAVNQLASHYDELLAKAVGFSKNSLLSEAQRRDALAQIDLIADEKEEAIANLKKQQAEKRAAEELKFENEHALAKANLRILLAKREEKTNPEELQAAMIAKIELERDIELQNTKLTEEQRQLIIQDSQDKIDAIRQASSDKQKEMEKRALQQIQQYTQQMFTTLGNMITRNDANELTKLTKNRDKRLALLEDQKTKGIVTEEQYQAQKASIEQEYADKTAETKRDQFIRQRDADVVKAGIEGIMAVMKTLAELGPAAAPVIPFIEAATALNIASILAAPIPEFAEGGSTAGRFTAQQALGLPHVNLSRSAGGMLPSSSAFLATVNEEGQEYFVPHRLLGDPLVASSVALIEHIRRGGSATMMPAFVEGGGTSSTPMPSYSVPVATGPLDAGASQALLVAINRLNYNLENPTPTKSYVVQKELDDAAKQLAYLQSSSSF